VNNAQIVRFEALRSLAFGSISGTYAAIGSALTHACRMIGIDNLTDVNVTISFNGSTDHTVIPPGSGKIFDFSTNRAEPVGFLELPSNTTVYAKQTSGAPSSGSVYVTVMYASTT
jgi:hypothetical protein